MPAGMPHVEVSAPRLLGVGAVAIIWAYGLLVAVPVVVAALVISVCQFGLLSFLLPLAAIGITVIFLPFGCGNAHVSRIVAALKRAAPDDQDGYTVQLTLRPRLRSGLRAFAEDADDMGFLTLADSELVFQGDSVKLTLPWGQINEVRTRNVGWRGLFVYGGRIVVTATGLPNVKAIEFAERSSLLLPSSRKASRELCERLEAAWRRGAAVENKGPC